MAGRVSTAGAGDELEERCSKMFVVGAFNPVGSGLPSSRTIATKDLVQRAWAVVEVLQLSQSHCRT